jgi:hypothetical protein
MENADIQKKIEAFLKELAVPSFIIFGWKKDTPPGASAKTEYGVVSSYHKMPTNAAVKGMAWALHDFVNRSL